MGIETILGVEERSRAPSGAISFRSMAAKNDWQLWRGGKAVGAQGIGTDEIVKESSGGSDPRHD